MMKMILIAAALGTTALSSPAMAQAAQPAAPSTRGHMQADRTRQDAQQMADGMFQRFDANHDGMVTRDEAQQALAQAAAARGGDDSDQGGGRAQRMLDRMFGDAQSVTLAQFEGQALTRFDREDLNHDGVVTSAERKEGWSNRAQ